MASHFPSRHTVGTIYVHLIRHLLTFQVFSLILTLLLLNTITSSNDKPQSLFQIALTLILVLPLRLAYRFIHSSITNLTVTSYFFFLKKKKSGVHHSLPHSLLPTATTATTKQTNKQTTTSTPFFILTGRLTICLLPSGTGTSFSFSSSSSL